MAAIERERRDSVEIIRFNRPEARNAVNFAVSSAIETALDEIETDPDVKVVVFTGNGTTFCAGADLKEIAQGKGGDIITRRGGFAGLVARTFPKPIIAAVNGPALAGGFEVVLACDLVVAAEHATFGIPEAAKGLFAGAGGLIRLPKRIPLAIAAEFAITGDPVDARRAYELGLVNRIVPADEVLDAALALATRIAKNGPLAVRNSLTMVREAVDMPEPEAWKRNTELALEVFGSKDAIEGATAFAEKREPRWTGI
jgi:enoyl-CoA hydratase